MKFGAFASPRLSNSCQQTCCIVSGLDCIKSNRASLEQIFSMNWDDDNKFSLVSNAMAEPIPPTLAPETKKPKFGVSKSTEFKSPTNNTNTTLGFPNRKVSQGRGTTNTRGGDESWNGLVAADKPKQKITPGQSLSINKPQEKKETPQLSLDVFSRVSLPNNQGGRNQLELSSKTSSNYSAFQKNTHSNNFSPNPPPLSNPLMRLQPTTTASRGGTGQSTDLVYIGHTTANRTSTNSGTTSGTTGAGSRGHTQPHGAGRSSTQSYEEKKAQQVDQGDEQPFRPRSRQHNNNYPQSNTLPRPNFETPYKGNPNSNTNSNNTKNNTTNSTYINQNTRNTRNSTRKTPSNEVIELLDSDIEEVAPTQKNQHNQKLDDEIFRLYGSLPGFTDEQKRHAFSRTEDRIVVENIYLGIYRFDSNGTTGSTNNSTKEHARKLYLRVDGGNNQCILLCLNTDMDNANNINPDKTISADPIVIEEIPFGQIKKIMCGTTKANDTLAFLTLSVHATLSLNCANVGPNCMLCPTLTHNTQDSGKFILIMLKRAALETFVSQMRAVPSVAKKKKEWLTYRLDWPASDVKELVFAHHNRTEHSIEELRERAQLELENKRKTQRRKNRSSLRDTSITVADPEDCLTYAMYPIEPEVLDAITIFKGDLKKLAPEEYLNDNLIDLKIKHFAATELDTAQVAAIHVFNCMFYTCLTTPKSPEQGHKVVSRWTNKVDLFKKDYIVIPINYSYHWSLAVIIRPGAVQSTLAQLQADIAHWQNWTNDKNNNTGKKGQPSSAKKSVAVSNSGSKKKGSSEDVVQDLTLSNSNTQSSNVNPSEATDSPVKDEPDLAADPTVVKDTENSSNSGSSLETDEEECKGDKEGEGKEGRSEEGSESSTEEMDVVPSEHITHNTPLHGQKALEVLERVVRSTNTKSTPTPTSTDKPISTRTSRSSALNTPTTATSSTIHTATFTTTPSTSLPSTSLASNPNDDYFVDSHPEVPVTSSEEERVNHTCIIHMDSLGMHSTAAVGKALSEYLRFEWEARKKAELDAELDALLKSDVNKSMSTEEVEKMKKALEARRKLVFKHINVVKIKVPSQANGYDCGLFVTKFAELVLRNQPSSTDFDIQSKFGNILRSDAFSQVDVDKERKNMLAMIERIRSDWLTLRNKLQTEAASATSESDTNNKDNNNIVNSDGNQDATRASAATAATVVAAVDPVSSVDGGENMDSDVSDGMDVVGADNNDGSACNGVGSQGISHNTSAITSNSATIANSSTKKRSNSMNSVSTVALDQDWNDEGEDLGEEVLFDGVDLGPSKRTVHSRFALGAKRSAGEEKSPERESDTQLDALLAEGPDESIRSPSNSNSSSPLDSIINSVRKGKDEHYRHSRSRADSQASSQSKHHEQDRENTQNTLNTLNTMNTEESALYMDCVEPTIQEIPVFPSAAATATTAYDDNDRDDSSVHSTFPTPLSPPTQPTTSSHSIPGTQSTNTSTHSSPVLVPVPIVEPVEGKIKKSKGDKKRKHSSKEKDEIKERSIQSREVCPIDDLFAAVPDPDRKKNKVKKIRKGYEFTTTPEATLLNATATAATGGASISPFSRVQGGVNLSRSSIMPVDMSTLLAVSTNTNSAPTDNTTEGPDAIANPFPKPISSPIPTLQQRLDQSRRPNTAAGIGSGSSSHSHSQKKDKEKDKGKDKDKGKGKVRVKVNLPTAFLAMAEEDNTSVP